MIQYALASRTHDSEAIDYCRSYGISMEGPVPSAFKLPDREVLQLKSACSLGSTVGMFYLTSSFVCFESSLPADEDDAADAESAKTCFPTREIANCRHHVMFPMKSLWQPSWGTCLSLQLASMRPKKSGSAVSSNVSSPGSMGSLPSSIHMRMWIGRAVVSQSWTLSRLP